ncbi:MAG: hypothetical protein WD016_09025 [Balneolaceae bacterium]
MKIRVLFGVLMYGILIAGISSCSGKASENSSESLNEIPEITPVELTSFDHAGDVYFSHLGYSSVVLKNGNILIPERGNTTLVVVDTEGNLKNSIYEGRGPGEILDAYSFVQDDEGYLYVYDQGNAKILILTPEAELAKEIIPSPFENGNMSHIFPMENGNYMLEYSTYGHLFNEEEDREKVLVNFNPDSEQYEGKIALKDVPYAPLVLDGKVSGGKRVDFADAQLAAYYSKNKSLLLFETGTQIIAEINSSYDTLNTISVNLPREKLLKEEIDKIEKEVNYREQWNSLQPLLPEYKAVASKMMFHEDEIWLKSNMRGEHQKWIVLNMEGQIIKIVNLPKESILMHISKEHLGVRLDDVTFALFEPVDLN